MKSITPPEILTNEDYKAILRELEESPDGVAYLVASSKHFLPANPSYFIHLERALEPALRAGFKWLNELLISNPSMTVEEAKSEDYKYSELLRNQIARVQLNTFHPKEFQTVANLIFKHGSELINTHPFWGGPVSLRDYVFDWVDIKELSFDDAKADITDTINDKSVLLGKELEAYRQHLKAANGDLALIRIAEAVKRNVDVLRVEINVYRDLLGLLRPQAPANMELKPPPLTITQKRLKLFLVRPKGITANDFYREVAKAVPKLDGNPPKFKTIGTKYNQYKNGDKQESKDIIELIVSELEAEGKAIDRNFLELIRRYSY